MNLRDELLKEHSKAQTNRVIKYVGDDKIRMRELMQLFTGNENIVTQRAAWAMSYIGITHPALIKPYHTQMLKQMNIPGVHDAIKRNVLRIWQEVMPPEDLWGETYDVCFKLLRSMEESIAIKAFAMTVMYNIALKYPELKDELIATIEDMIPYGSPAIANRGKKIVKLLEKL
jgi:hypothetical protein